MSDSADFTIQPYEIEHPVKVTVRVEPSAEGNLYVDVDGKEYGSLFFYRGERNRLVLQLGQYDWVDEQWTMRNPIDSVLSTRPKPDLPTIGQALPEGVAIAALWSTEEPELDGAYTAHVLLAQEHGEYGVYLYSWNDGDRLWDALDGDTYPSLPEAAEQWKRVTQ